MSWLQGLTASTSENVQLAWMNPGGTNYVQEFSLAADQSKFQGQEDVENAWMWAHHPLRAYFKLNVGGAPIFVTGKQALIVSAIGSVFIYLKFLH